MSTFARLRVLAAVTAIAAGCGSDDVGVAPRADVPPADAVEEAGDAGEDAADDAAETGDDALPPQDTADDVADTGDDAPDVTPMDVVSPDAPTPDAALDVAPDRAPDAALDVAPDRAPDAALDVAPDRAPAAALDVAPDRAPDAALDVAPDRAPDAALDVSPDRAPDVALDVAPDRAPDVAADVAPDGPTCGNGRIDAAEECDDGNRTRWDGCSDVCRLEQTVRIDTASLVGGGRAITDACDLTGDRVNDNRLGQALTDLALGQVNMGLQTSFSSGGTIVLAALLDLDDRTGVNDPAVRVAFFEGLDAVAPFTGMPGEAFAIRAMALNAARDPVSVLAPGSIVARALNAGPGTAILTLDLGAGPTPLALSRATTRATTNLDTAAMRIGTLTAGRLCGAVSAGDLDRIPAPMGLPAGCLSPRGGSSLMDVIAVGCSISIIPVINAQQPDIDGGGDGIFQGGTNRVLRDTNGDRIIDTCRDGTTGVTITGDNCAQDARLDDAYSMALSYAARRVVITQVR